MLEAAGILLAQRRVLVQQGGGVEQQVVEIDRVVRQQHLLVAGIGAPHHLVPVGLPGVDIRQDQLVLGVGDGGQDGLRAVALLVQVQLGDHPLHQAHLVVIVEDDEIGGDRQVLGLAAQDAGAGGMEGAQADPLGALAQQVEHPAFHLAGGLVGEGDRQDLVGAHAQLADQVGDALGEHAGLAGAGAGQHQHRPKPGGDSLLLLRVESSQKIHAAHCNRKRIVEQYAYVMAMGSQALRETLWRL